MKKTVVISFMFLCLGLIVGTKIYDTKNSITGVFNNKETYYFLQEGVYSSKEIMEENTKMMNTKVVDYKNNKYYVYIGITKEIDIAKKIKNIYENEGHQIYIKEEKIENEELSSNITQFDLLINSTKDTNEILTIMEVVLANYEEIIKKQ